MVWTRNPGSFRDPSGFVYLRGGVLYRQVNLSFADAYDRLIDSGLYAELSGEGLLVEHDEVGPELAASPPVHRVLRPRQIGFISYPYEWCFGQLKAAALLTLQVQKRALARGLVLRDASAFNVQFDGGRPVFIDTLSFGPYVEGEPWVAYRQFCEHFLAPLVLVSRVHASLGQLARIHVDGVPLELASRLLPRSTRWRPGLLTHVHLHARSIVRRSGDALDAVPATRRGRMSRTALTGLVDSLERTVRGLSWTPPESTWSDYYDRTNYTEDAQDHKKQLVARFLDLAARGATPRMIWDVGANTGLYSDIAARTGALVVSLDMDHAAVERHFAECVARGETLILPLVQDLSNPSGGLGWSSTERRSLAERGPADVALALALVHHLAIGANVPLADVAAFFHHLCRKLIIEFVPKDDSQVRLMLAVREDVFPGYTRRGFEDAFRTHFTIDEAADIVESRRTLYLMARR